MNPDPGHVDPALDALLRAHSAETPPAEVDATILAAAHRAVRSTPREAEKGAEATRPWRWWMPLAAAATIGAIAIGVLQLSPKEPDTTSTIVSDTPPVVAVPAQPAAPPASSTAQDKVERPRAATVSSRRILSRRSGLLACAFRIGVVPSATPIHATEAPRAKVRSDRAAQAPPSRVEAERAPAPEPFPAANDKPVRESAGNAAGTVQRSAAAPSAPAAMAKSALADAHVRSAAEWIERIRTSFTEGKLAEAAQELTAFRAAYVDADARLPADLQAWAATVKR